VRKEEEGGMTGERQEEEERSGSQGIRLGRSRSFSRHAPRHVSRGGSGGRERAIPRVLDSVFLT
jgi:hypothetical protein